MSDDPDRSAWVRIEDEDELLWRQVAADWLTNGRLSSQAFRPMTKDHGLLSAARSAKVSAQEAFELHVRRGNESAGVAAVTVGEVGEVSLDVWDDSSDADKPDEHASVDFTLVSGNRARTLGDLLARKARERGWSYTPPPGPPPPITQPTT